MSSSLSSSFKLAVAPFSPATGASGSDMKVATVAMVKGARDDLPLQVQKLPLTQIADNLHRAQVGGKEEQKKQAMEPLTMVSRRDLGLHLAAASLVGAALFLPEHAEARILSPETKRKILEKLRMLREKVGLSVPKAENEEKIAPTQPSHDEKEKSLPTRPISPFPVHCADKPSRIPG